jgi:hypothetical protein
VTLTKTGLKAQNGEVDETLGLEIVASQIKKLCEFGATDAEIASFFDISVQVLGQWRIKNEIVANALKIGKVGSDQRVERSLFDRAVGCERPAVKVFFNPRTGQVVEHHYMERYPPDPLCMTFWLKNRKPETWRERYDLPTTPPEEAAALAQEVMAKLMAESK